MLLVEGVEGTVRRQGRPLMPGCGSKRRSNQVKGSQPHPIRRKNYLPGRMTEVLTTLDAARLISHSV